MYFGRLLTAMVTPFDEHGEVDYGRTSKLIEHLLDTGTDGLVVAGTTGESPTLTTREKVELFKYIVKEVNGRVPVLAGTGSNNTRASIELTREVESIGIDGIMLVVPYYNKPSQEGLYQHFSQIAASTSLPVMLYNIPGRSSVNMTPETIIRLSQVDNIVSVKEASGDLDAVSQIIEETGDDFSVYSGDDGMTLPILSIGGTGVVSVAAHVIGKDMRAMVQNFLDGNVTEAAGIHRRIVPVVKALFQAPSPSPVKEALNEINVPVGSVRLPLIPLSDVEKANLTQTLVNFQTNTVEN
ncbi:4-hydroxy-tetrahydrodipicolinate synthase [Oceanobacillus indicireducens]|uniref:4-hydroxy-tetrahydrodipicolinate synthase n=1 Tax=Oceanobacillus indicireducens TaxID=1004261 RepID=A0A917Y2W7_9BACI|nr:4-hydroxy-tetrahydrodipicolinate synthase [Oceanobacillus indicireducens]GGN65669.1 4-hydroxy-tetrahydrodipicolinate synthase [Oceanobacillus indicireducens]